MVDSMRWRVRGGGRWLFRWAVRGVVLLGIVILLLLPYCAALIIGGSNSPFIYYRF